MTAAMQHDLDQSQPVSAAQLDAGSFVYLWPGGEHQVGRPILAKVENATAHVIQARDLGAKVRGSYDVSEATPYGMRWTWELAATPDDPLAGCEVEIVDRATLSREERRQLLLGNQGRTLLFHLADQTSVAGVVTKVVYDGPDPVWLFVASLPDSMKAWIVKIQVEKITQIKEVDGA